MNIFCSQSIQTQIELEEIADVKRQIILPSNSRTIIGLVQDGLLGAYNLTAPSMRVDWRNTMNIMSYTGIDDFSAIKKNKDYTGHELFSLIIPPKININKGNAFNVQNGKLLSGQLNQEALGAKKKNTLHQLIWDEYGPDQTQRFIDNAQKLVNNFNLYNAMTVGIGDIAIKKDVEKQINKVFQTYDLKVEHMITDLENNPELMDNDLFERRLMAELNVVRDDISKLLMANLEPLNNVNIMIKSGSKGDPTNYGQMSGCVGLQAAEGKLPQKKINGRTLPYFFQNDDRSEARGLVKPSFINGMGFPQFFFLNMAGREGLIDSAIKSVTYETEIVVLEDDITKNVKIGQWIDEKLEKSKDKIKHYKERDMELLDIKEKIYIPTCDEDGNVTWGDITAITRHDPGNELYEIKTHGGRSVIVTESKSLLIWNKEKKKFLMKDTPLVKVGDYVPVTMSLAKPPVINNFIDMTKYFSKNEYLYGSDFIKAEQEIKNVMENRNEKLPPGWWNKNNGTTFTLPYTQAHRFERAISGRSNIDNIKEGYIYPFSTNRDHILIPEKFMLDEDNGKFIGLFLAEGNVDKNYVQITNNNINIRNFVKSWFDKYSIKYEETQKINKIGGLTSAVRGFSSILSKFLTKLVGHGARNKYVPHEAFNAPDSFIKGLINGYISGDGTITRNSIQVGSASPQLIHGINMLCSRFDIFGKTTRTIMKKNNLGTKDIAPVNMLAIRCQWATKFSQTFELMDEIKHEKLQKLTTITTKTIHPNFNEKNDVVLDEIIEISKVDVSKHPKVYDLTIPSTLNFGLANGLHVVDTASSGYIQRKLIKSLEDATMKYDCTVRTVNNNILQFVYGDTGANTIYQYDHPIKIINLNNSEIENKYKFTAQEIKNFKFSEKDNEKYIEKLIELRDILRKSQFKSRMNYITMTDIFMIPVNLSRIVDSVKNDESLKTKEKLEPSYVIDELEKLLTNDETKLILMNKSNKFKPQDERICKTSFEVAVHDLIAPKRCVFEYNLSKTQFDEIVKQIKDSYNKNMMEPGEHVGIIAAQSMGEPTTQMTLNNFHHAGIAAVSTTTQGVPRVQELLSLSKNIKTPQMIIYLNDEYSKSYEMAKKIASYIKFTTLGHIRSKINVYYDPNPYEKGGFMEQDNVYNIYYSHNPSKNSCQADINNLPWLMRIELDREKLIDKEVTLLDIKSKFCNQWEKRYNDLKGIKKEEKAILDKIVQTALLSNTDNDKTPIIHLRFDMTDFEITTINNFIEFMIDKFKLKGIPSIHDISTITEERALSYDKKDGSLIEGNQWVIYTQGENLYDIRYLTGIDVYKTICNDVVQVYQTFGIEAARATLIREITYAYERASQVVNYHHLSILVDLMTSSGQLTSVDRHGMSKTDNDVLARASFEKMVDQVINAAIFGEVDHMKGVSSRIMAGLVVRGGTGMCDVILDTKALEKSEFIEDIQQNYNKTYKDITANTIISDVINKEGAGDIFMPM